MSFYTVSQSYPPENDMSLSQLHSIKSKFFVIFVERIRVKQFGSRSSGPIMSGPYRSSGQAKIRRLVLLM